MSPHWLRGAIAAACFALAPQLHAQSVALTFDDGPHLGATPRLSAQARNEAMLAALAKHKVKAALFVTAANGAVKPEGLALARAWGQAGHAVGNHTMTHPDLNSAKVSLAQYQQELLDCDRIIATLPGYQKWFRFTYLREGNTLDKRNGMRAFLRENGYRNAYVSLDTSDWRLDAKLVEVLEKDPGANVEPIRVAYLSHIRQRALAYRALAQRLQGRDIPQVLLLHHNLINAMWLDDVIRQFREMGWAVTTPAQALADPVYQLMPERAAPGQSLLLSMGRSLGLSTAELGLRLMDDGDVEIEALKQQGL
ncbi:polysaccharide deacetylase family protein [Massilia yuzhufengensis]|uniref:Peptidoglycan/xylan/chitin deacetylase, PgdA/CDA1 family n=1 Tax=Massilia yuzhufengensis TaxID=1164594 RepID=A0A1I1DBN2_9BURK|nr:polysaccharide deacetylase family protein [Massilia yuzhufengensis]SFB70200.1 Peptidoglycan/xylan/chitin deacetylase, PgdA/CDA1 family [Massilia yuzhufengensis]